MIFPKWIFATAAIFSLATANELQQRNVLVDAVKNGLANAEQRIDSTTQALKNDDHPGRAIVVNAIAGLDGQIDNVIDLVSQAIDPVLSGHESTFESIILGPTFQSITDGLEVVVGNVVGGVLDIALVPAVKMLSGTVSRVSTVAKQVSMPEYSQKFADLSSKLNQAAIDAQKKKSASQKIPRNAISEGFSDAATNVQMHLDSMTSDLKKQDRPASAVLVNFIQGLDGQIDNIISVVANLADPILSGHQSVVEQTILGPTFQSITDGVEVLIGNVAGGAIDAVLVPGLKLLSGSVKQVANIAGEYKLTKNQEKLNQQSQQLIELVSRSEKAPKNKRSGGNIQDSVAGINNNIHMLASQTIPGKAAIAYRMSSIQDEVSTLIDLLSTEISPMSYRLTTSGNPAAIGSAFNAITGGTESLINSISDGRNGVGLVPGMNTLSVSLNQALSLATRARMLEAGEKLAFQVKQLAGLSSEAHDLHHSLLNRRDVSSDPNSELDNIGKHVDNAVQQFKSGSSNIASSLTFANNLHSQIDRVNTMLATTRLDASTPSLSTNFKGLADGLDVYINNLLGGQLGLHIVPITKILSGGLGSLSSACASSSNSGISEYSTVFNKQHVQLEKWIYTTETGANKHISSRDVDSSEFQSVLAGERDKILQLHKTISKQGKNLKAVPLLDLNDEINNVIGAVSQAVSQAGAHSKVESVVNPTFDAISEALKGIGGQISGTSIGLDLSSALSLLRDTTTRLAQVSGSYGIGNYERHFTEISNSLNLVSSPGRKRDANWGLFRRGNSKPQDVNTQAFQIVNEARSKLDNQIGIFTAGDYNPNPARVQSFISQFSRDIVDANDAIHQSMNIAQGSSDQIKTLITSPAYTSALSGAQILVNTVGSSWDPSYSSGVQELISGLNTMSQTATSYSQDGFAKSLSLMINQLKQFSGKLSRRDASSANDHVNSVKSDLDRMATELASGGGGGLLGGYFSDVQGSFNQILQAFYDIFHPSANIEVNVAKSIMAPALQSAEKTLTSVTETARKSQLSQEDIISAQMLVNTAYGLARAAGDYGLNSERVALERSAKKLSQVATPR